MPWRFSVGNVVKRAPGTIVASRSSAADTIHPLSRLGNGHPDECAQWVRNAAGQYGADIDTNLLATSTARADAPTGWADLTNALAGTPGLPANPPDWGTYASRSALRAYRPVYQDVTVMPGETVRVKAGIYLPSGSSCTSVFLRCVDLSNGYHYNGSTNAWAAGTVTCHVGSTNISDTWADLDETIVPQTTKLERSTYRIIIDATAASWDATSYVYCSAPLVLPKWDLAAIIGHNIATGSTVQLQPQPSGDALTLTPAQPSFFATFTSVPDPVQTWRLAIDVPSAMTGFAERPMIGELWLGSATSMVWCPSYPFTIEERDFGQVRVIGGRGRVDAYTDSPRAARRLSLTFKSNDAGYKQIRDQLNHATLYGSDPCLMLPIDTMEGSTAIYHGHLGPEISWQRTGLTRRAFTVQFDESPFPIV